MKCKILHEARGHMRVHLVCGRMTLKEADVLEYYLRAVDGVKEVKQEKLWFCHCRTGY